MCMSPQKWISSTLVTSSSSSSFYSTMWFHYKGASAAETTIHHKPVTSQITTTLKECIYVLEDKCWYFTARTRQSQSWLMMCGTTFGILGPSFCFPPGKLGTLYLWSRWLPHRNLLSHIHVLSFIFSWSIQYNSVVSFVQALPHKKYKCKLMYED